MVSLRRLQIDVQMRYETAPSQHMQIDFGHWEVLKNGKKVEPSIFWEGTIELSPIFQALLRLIFTPLGMLNFVAVSDMARWCLQDLEISRRSLLGFFPGIFWESIVDFENAMSATTFS